MKVGLDRRRPVPGEAYASIESIAAQVRQAALAAGVGVDQPEAPLRGIIAPGMTVLLKPNWVLHVNEGGGDIDCLVTHPNFVLAVLQEVVAARPGKIILGDAPIQGCQWDQLITLAFQAQVAQAAGNIPVEIIDFRRVILPPGGLAEGVRASSRPAGRYQLFDLGADSLLEPISRPTGRFRVTMYDPRKLAETHRPGRHQYLLCREAFEADLILNLPKLKMHRKAGLTGALKNLVGLNGNKDYLPHHRVGGSAWGGDCYPGLAPLKRLAESCLDHANQKIGTAQFSVWNRRSRRLLRLHRRLGGDTDMEGAWYGNDTVWRMSLDLNRILLYGRADGTLADTPQRQAWSICDAIVCGQGEGPLAPRPLPMGVVSLSGSSAAADWVHALLLGLAPERIPLLRHAFDNFRWPLTDSQAASAIQVAADGEVIPLPQVLERLGTRGQPPRGWAGHCEVD